MEKNLILVRGVSGSGKTTFAELMAGGKKNSVFAADDFFYTEAGEYNFDATKLRFAHEDCRLRVEAAMRNEMDKIFVSNTFTRIWEMQAYLDLANEYNYRVFTIVVENRHGGVNVHDVPEEVLEVQKKRFEIKL